MMYTELIFSTIVVPFMSGMLAGTYARSLVKVLIIALLVAAGAVALAVTPLHDLTLTQVQSSARDLVLAARHANLHLSATALGGFLVGCVIDRLRHTR